MKRLTIVPAIAVALFASCSEPRSGDLPSVRLVDLLDPEAIGGAAPEGVNVESEGALPLSAWRAGPGVAGLEMRDGKLHGRSTDPHPVIYTPLPAWSDMSDTVDSVELAISISAGSQIRGTIGGGDEPNFEHARYNAETNELFLKADIVAVLGMQTITMPQASTQRLAGSRFLYLSPTNVADADFEIEAVRLVTTSERLASTPSGIAWQGLSDIFRESIVSRSPESFSIDVTIPPGAWLDLSLGGLSERPITFEVSAGQDPATEPLLRQTITTPKRWEPAVVDLAGYAGRTVTLNFALTAEQDNTLGLWGNPTIRVPKRDPAALAEASNAISAEPPRNVILIQADTLRRDHLQFHGYERPTAPTLARMASEGALFTDNISPASWTKVATPSIMTSLYPTSHTVADFPDRLPAAATTLAELYREAGYATLAYSSIMFTGKFTNLHQGYDELHEFGSLSEESAKTSREYVDRLTTWIDRHPDTPFFAFLQVFDPHSPFEPRSPYNTLWADPAGRDEHLSRIAKLKPFVKSFYYSQQLGTRKETDAAGIEAEQFWDYHKGWYDGSIRGMDSEIARLLERLQSHGSLDDTLIVFFSDHGEEFHEHGGAFHGGSVYGELTNVPLFFSWPAGLPGGVAVAETVRSIDIMPTVVEISRLPAPEGMQGQSLLPLMIAARDAPDDRDGLLATAADLGWRPEAAVSENVTVGDDKLRATALISGEWRLIHNSFIPAKDRPEYELFNHRQDPLNLQNVAEEHSEIVERLKNELSKWREAAVSAMLEEENSTEGMTPQEIERLKSLGYVQ